jgi:hypothetical protein
MANTSAVADELMMTAMRRTEFVLNGTVTYQQWGDALITALKWYKQRYPNINYLEALNERDWTNPLTKDQYYGFYKQCYRAANAVNADLKPVVPIKIGGVALESLARETFVTNFLDAYKADTDPGKRLDYFSYHSYANQDFTELSSQLSRIQGWLSARGLPTTLPIHLDEYGPWTYKYPETGASTAYAAATCLTKVWFWQYSGGTTRNQIIPYQYAFKPNPSTVNFYLYSQISKDDTQLTTIGNAMLASSRLQDGRVSASTNALSGFIGVMPLATASTDKVTILAWNYQGWDRPSPVDYQTNFSIANLPSGFTNKQVRIRHHLIDATTSNYVANPATAALTQVKDVTVAAGSAISTSQLLKMNGIVLIELTPVAPPPSASVANQSFESGFSGWSMTGNAMTLTNQGRTDGSSAVALGAGNTVGNAVISQTLTTVNGARYGLMFDYGAFGVANRPQRLKVDVLNGSTVLASQAYTANGPGSFDPTKTTFITYTLPFTATSTATTIRFTDQTTAADSRAVDGMLDFVRLVTMAVN